METTIFNSERWDVNLIINNERMHHGKSERLFALYLLWRGRANDIIDHDGNLQEANTYLKAADELSTVLELVFGEENVR